MKQTVSILFFLVFSLTSFAQVKKTNKPKGTFVMENSNCAGMRFNNDNSITFINEMGCTPWELNAKWVTDKIFITTEKEVVQENCPPRVDVNEIISFDGKTLKLKSYWTGWGKQKDDIITMKKG